MATTNDRTIEANGVATVTAPAEGAKVMLLSPSGVLTPVTMANLKSLLEKEIMPSASKVLEGTRAGWWRVISYPRNSVASGIIFVTVGYYSGNPRGIILAFGGEYNSARKPIIQQIGGAEGIDAARFVRDEETDIISLEIKCSTRRFDCKLLGFGDLSLDVKTVDEEVTQGTVISLISPFPGGGKIHIPNTLHFVLSALRGERRVAA